MKNRKSIFKNFGKIIIALSLIVPSVYIATSYDKTEVASAQEKPKVEISAPKTTTVEVKKEVVVKKEVKTAPVVKNIVNNKKQNVVVANKVTQQPVVKEAITITDPVVKETAKEEIKTTTPVVKPETTNKALTLEQAKLLLVKINDKINYIYQGDENTFKATLLDKGLQGYVFLPDVPTDIGYFVNKNTQQIYYFHPSGYMELVK